MGAVEIRDLCFGGCLASCEKQETRVRARALFVPEKRETCGGASVRVCVCERMCSRIL